MEPEGPLPDPSSYLIKSCCISRSLSFPSLPSLLFHGIACMGNTAAAATITITTTTTTAIAARLLKLCSLFNSQDKRTYFLFLFLLESTSPKTRPGLQARTWILQIPHQCTDMAGSSKHMHRRGCSPPNCQLR